MLQAQKEPAFQASSPKTFKGQPRLAPFFALLACSSLLPFQECPHRAKDSLQMARSIFARAGEILGRGLANLINVFDPQRIIVGGEGVRSGEWLFGPMRAAIALHVLPSLASDAEIRVEPWGDDAWARGAASLVLRELFESPVRK